MTLVYFGAGEDIVPLLLAQHFDKWSHQTEMTLLKAFVDLGNSQKILEILQQIHTFLFFDINEFDSESDTLLFVPYIIYKLKKSLSHVSWKHNAEKKLINIEFGIAKQKLKYYYKTCIFKDVKCDLHLQQKISEATILFLRGFVPISTRKKYSLLHKKLLHNCQIVLIERGEEESEEVMAFLETVKKSKENCTIYSLNYPRDSIFPLSL
jgi:hypothetical protein